MSLYRIIKRTSWFVMALACIGIGLTAAGIDLEALLHLKDLDMTLRCFVGLCGAAALVDLIVLQCMPSASNCCSKK